MTNEKEQKTFKYFVPKGITVKESDDGVKTVEVPIQSLEQDRDGDVITELGQEKIVEALKSGKVAAFPNHGFGDYPALYAFQDIMGKWIDGYSKDGITYGVLQPRKGNDSAEQMLDLLGQDMPLGFSIGFIVREYEESENGGLIISDLELLEVSPVGIPSNPKAVHGNNAQVAMAAKSAVENGGTYKDIKMAIKSAGENMEDDKIKNQEQDASENKPEDKTLEQDSKENSEQGESSEDEEDQKQVGESEFTEFVASHYEGLGPEDTASMFEEHNFEGLKEQELASLVANHLGITTGEVLEMFENAAGDGEEGEEGEEGSEEDSGKSATPEDDSSGDEEDDKSVSSEELKAIKEQVSKIDEALKALKFEREKPSEDKKPSDKTPKETPKKIKAAEEPEEKDFNKYEPELTGYEGRY